MTTGPSIGYLVGQRTTGEVSINSCIRCTSDNILHDIDVAQQLLPAGMIGRWRDGNILVHYEKDHDRYKDVSYRPNRLIFVDKILYRTGPRNDPFGTPHFIN